METENEAPELRPEYESYLDRRYADLKQVYAALVAFYDPEEIEDNHLYLTIEAELNMIAEMLNYETTDVYLSRMCGIDDESEDE